MSHAIAFAMGFAIGWLLCHFFGPKAEALAEEAVSDVEDEYKHIRDKLK